MNIALILKFLYPTAVPIIDFELHSIGDGIVTISKWNLKLGVQPTIKQLTDVSLTPEYQIFAQNYDSRTEKDKLHDLTLFKFAQDNSALLIEKGIDVTKISFNKVATTVEITGITTT